MPTPTRKACLALGALVALLVPAAVVESAVPKRGGWSGTTSQGRPVKFRVAVTGHRHPHRVIKGLELGIAGPPPSGVKISCSSDPNDYVDSRFTTTDSIKIGKRGRFSTKFDTQGTISKGTLSITGKFKTSKKARGRMRWKINRTDDGRTCNSGLVTFTATKK